MRPVNSKYLYEELEKPCFNCSTVGDEQEPVVFVGVNLVWTCTMRVDVHINKSSNVIVKKLIFPQKFTF